MTTRHCAGCEGYVSWISECPGMTMGEFETPDVVPPLRLLDRLRALVGMSLFLGVTPDPQPAPADPEALEPGRWGDGGVP
jgi:hypothetical protein